MVLGKSYNHENRILRDYIVNEGYSSSELINKFDSIKFDGIFDSNKYITRLTDKGNLESIYNIGNKLEIIKHNKTKYYNIQIINKNNFINSYNELESISIFYKLDSSRILLDSDKFFRNINYLINSKENKLLLPIYDSKHLKKVFNSVKKIENEIMTNTGFDLTPFCEKITYIKDKKKHINLLSKLDEELGKYLPLRR